MKFQDVLKAQNAQGMEPKQIAQFHAHNENGLYKQYRTVYIKLEKLLDDQRITSAQFNKVMSVDFNTSELLRLAELKQPQKTKLNNWIANAEKVINHIEEYLDYVDVQTKPKTNDYTKRLPEILQALDQKRGLDHYSYTELLYLINNTPTLKTAVFQAITDQKKALLSDYTKFTKQSIELIQTIEAH